MQLVQKRLTFNKSVFILEEIKEGENNLVIRERLPSRPATSYAFFCSIVS